LTGVQLAALIVVALTGTFVAVIRSPLRQALAVGIFGLSLTVLFFAFQAPDVALSEVVISTVGLPVMMVVALRKIAEQAEEQEREGDREV
jgi:energy-converting hydrogenase B subunit D